MKIKLEINIQSNRQSDKKINIEHKRNVQEYILRNI